jgi:hypothetical protein
MRGFVGDGASPVDAQCWLATGDIQKTSGGDMVASASVSVEEKGHGFALLTPAGDASEDDMRWCVEAVNADLPAWSCIRRCRAIPPITIDAGLMTPTMKARRTHIFAAYSESIHH